MRLGEHPVEAREIAQLRMDAAVVAYVVAPILERRRIDRAQPDRVDAERAVGAVVEVIEMGGDTVQVADSVAVGVGETARVNLVEYGGLPPWLVHRTCLTRAGELKQWRDSGSAL